MLRAMLVSAAVLCMALDMGMARADDACDKAITDYAQRFVSRMTDSGIAPIEFQKADEAVIDLMDLIVAAERNPIQPDEYERKLRGVTSRINEHYYAILERGVRFGVDLMAGSVSEGIGIPPACR